MCQVFGLKCYEYRTNKGDSGFTFNNDESTARLELEEFLDPDEKITFFQSATLKSVITHVKRNTRANP